MNLERHHRFSRCPVALVAMLLFVIGAPVVSRAQPVIEYLGNEGVRIDFGEVDVLIDALWSNDSDEFESVPANLLANITEAGKRSRDVDYLLVTHMHGDHFSADMVAGYLEANSRCTFISSSQVVDLLRQSKEWNAELDERVIEIDLDIGESLELSKLEKVTIDATWLRHAHRWNRDVVNLAFRIETKGKVVIHTGDADTATAKQFLTDTTADVALIGFWQWLSPEGEGTVEASPGVKRFVAIHVPTDSSQYEEAFARMDTVTLAKDPGEIVYP